jgi:hypothetical protein
MRIKMTAKTDPCGDTTDHDWKAAVGLVFNRESTC